MLTGKNAEESASLQALVSFCVPNIRINPMPTCGRNKGIELGSGWLKRLESLSDYKRTGVRIQMPACNFGKIRTWFYSD